MLCKMGIVHRQQHQTRRSNADFLRPHERSHQPKVMAGTCAFRALATASTSAHLMRRCPRRAHMPPLMPCLKQWSSAAVGELGCRKSYECIAITYSQFDTPLEYVVNISSKVRGSPLKAGRFFFQFAKPVINWRSIAARPAVIIGLHICERTDRFLIEGGAGPVNSSVGQLQPAIDPVPLRLATRKRKRRSLPPHVVPLPMPFRPLPANGAGVASFN